MSNAADPWDEPNDQDRDEYETELKVSDIMEKFDELFSGSPPAKPAATSPGNTTGDGHEETAGEGEPLNAEYHRGYIDGRIDQKEADQDEIDLWKDRCMSAERAHDIILEQYNKLFDSHQDEIDLWKDRCMAADEAHNTTIRHYDELLDSQRGPW